MTEDHEKIVAIVMALAKAYNENCRDVVLSDLVKAVATFSGNVIFNLHDNVSGDLDEDVHAVAAVVHHALDAGHLAGHALEAGVDVVLDGGAHHGGPPGRPVGAGRYLGEGIGGGRGVKRRAQARSKRSSSMTLVQAATKSSTSCPRASSLA